MPRLWFDEDASAALSALEEDETRARLLARVDEVLNRLDSDPGAASVRRHRFHEVGLWCVVIHDEDEHWVVLWEPHPEREGDVVVQYLGPATFP